MATRNAWRTEAPELTRAELQKRLPSETKIISFKTNSFYHEGEEHRYVTVIYKGTNPYVDSPRLSAIGRDIYQILWEHDFDPIPAIYYQEEGTNRI